MHEDRDPKHARQMSHYRLVDNPEGFYSQMFLVPKKDDQQRPVINLKRLNWSVITEHFKIEGIHMLKELLKAGDWRQR